MVSEQDKKLAEESKTREISESEKQQLKEAFRKTPLKDRPEAILVRGEIQSLKERAVAQIRSGQKLTATEQQILKSDPRLIAKLEQEKEARIRASARGQEIITTLEKFRGGREIKTETFPGGKIVTTTTPTFTISTRDEDFAISEEEKRKKEEQKKQTTQILELIESEIKKPKIDKEKAIREAVLKSKEAPSFSTGVLGGVITKEPELTKFLKEAEIASLLEFLSPSKKISGVISVGDPSTKKQISLDISKAVKESKKATGFATGILGERISEQSIFTDDFFDIVTPTKKISGVISRGEIKDFKPKKSFEQQRKEFLSTDIQVVSLGKIGFGFTKSKAPPIELLRAAKEDNFFKELGVLIDIGTKSSVKKAPLVLGIGALGLVSGGLAIPTSIQFVVGVGAGSIFAVTETKKIQTQISRSREGTIRGESSIRTIDIGTELGVFALAPSVFATGRKTGALVRSVKLPEGFKLDFGKLKDFGISFGKKSLILARREFIEGPRSVPALSKSKVAKLKSGKGRISKAELRQRKSQRSRLFRQDQVFGLKKGKGQKELKTFLRDPETGRITEKTAFLKDIKVPTGKIREITLVSKELGSGKAPKIFETRRQFVPRGPAKTPKLSGEFKRPASQVKVSGIKKDDISKLIKSQQLVLQTIKKQQFDKLSFKFPKQQKQVTTGKRLTSLQQQVSAKNKQLFEDIRLEQKQQPLEFERGQQKGGFRKGQKQKLISSLQQQVSAKSKQLSEDVKQQPKIKTQQQIFLNLVSKGRIQQKQQTKLKQQLKQQIIPKLTTKTTTKLITFPISKSESIQQQKQLQKTQQQQLSKQFTIQKTFQEQKTILPSFEIGKKLSKTEKITQDLDFFGGPSFPPSTRSFFDSIRPTPPPPKPISKPPPPIKGRIPKVPLFFFDKSFSTKLGQVGKSFQRDLGFFPSATALAFDIKGETSLFAKKAGIGLRRIPL